MSAADAPERPAWHVLLSVVGAATGIVVFVYFVGGVIVWERLHVLRLPANQGVPPLPRELFLVVGARALAWPLTLGFLAIVVVHTLCMLRPPNTRGAARAGYVGLVGLFAAALALAAIYATVQQAIFVGFFGILVGAGLALVSSRRATLRQASLGVFVSLALVGVVVEGIDIRLLPVRLEYAHVFFSDGRKEVRGFFIGGTADTVYIAPNESCHVRGWITALPRHEVRRLAIFSSVKAWPPLPAYAHAEDCRNPP